MAYMDVIVFCIFNKLVSIFMICTQDIFPDVFKFPFRSVGSHGCLLIELLLGISAGHKQHLRLPGQSRPILCLLSQSRKAHCWLPHLHAVSSSGMRLLQITSIKAELHVGLETAAIPPSNTQSQQASLVCQCFTSTYVQSCAAPK